MGPDTYPVAERTEVDEGLHGRRVPDPYRWLEVATDPRTVRWSQEQQELTERHVDGLAGRDRVAALLDSLLDVAVASPVKTAGPRRFRAGATAGRAARTVQVADGPGAPWRTAVDVGRREANVSVCRWEPSPHGTYLAVQSIVDGDEDSTPLSIVRVDTGAVLESSEHTRYSPVAWRADERSYFYVRRHRMGPGWGVYLHRVGSPVRTDDLVTGDDGPVTRFHLTLWHDRWLAISHRIGTGRSTGLRVVDLAVDGEPRQLPSVQGSASGVMVGADGRVFVLSTVEAEWGQVLVLEPDGRGAWGTPTVLLAQDRSAVLAEVNLVRVGPTDRLAVLRTRDGYSEMAIHDAHTGENVIDVQLPGEGTVSALHPTADPAVLAISYTDWTTPRSTWHVDLESGDATPARGDVVRWTGITVTRTTYPSFDGTEVPVTILAPSAGRPGPVPVLLTCYGGFGISMRPSVQPELLSWVRMGGAVVVAAVRGGGERGRGWHLAGAGRNKPVVVRDVHAAAEWLVSEGRTTARQLALLGASNGGLVLAAALVQRPDRFAAAAFAGAPLDMIRYERWGLGKAWREEYGSVADPLACATLLSYSPYHNVKPATGGYPALWFQTARNDTRVDPLHSRKMAALLQHATTGGPILLNVTESAGHTDGGPNATQAAAAMLVFLANHTGLDVSALPDRSSEGHGWSASPAAGSRSLLPH